MQNKDKLFKLVDTVVISELASESVLLNLNTGLYFQLNKLGTFIISQLKDYSTFNELLDKVILTFDVSPEKAHDDLLSFIKNLEEKKLVHSN